MKFADYLLNEDDRSSNSAAIIKDTLDKVGVGLEPVRQTQTKENTSTSIYKVDGHKVEAIWVMEDGPMAEEGYSEKDAETKLTELVTALESFGGSTKKSGSIKNKESAEIKFDEFTVKLTPFEINSALDGSGFDRTYLRIDIT